MAKTMVHKIIPSSSPPPSSSSPPTTTTTSSSSSSQSQCSVFGTLSPPPDILSLFYTFEILPFTPSKRHPPPPFETPRPLTGTDDDSETVDWDALFALKQEEEEGHREAYDAAPEVTRRSGPKGSFDQWRGRALAMEEWTVVSQSTLADRAYDVAASMLVALAEGEIETLAGMLCVYSHDAEGLDDLNAAAAGEMVESWGKVAAALADKSGQGMAVGFDTVSFVPPALGRGMPGKAVFKLDVDPEADAGLPPGEAFGDHNQLEIVLWWFGPVFPHANGRTWTASQRSQHLDANGLPPRSYPDCLDTDIGSWSLSSIAPSRQQRAFLQ